MGKPHVLPAQVGDDSILINNAGCIAIESLHDRFLDISCSACGMDCAFTRVSVSILCSMMLNSYWRFTAIDVLVFT